MSNIEDIVNDLEKFRSCFQKDLSLEQVLVLLEETYTCFQKGKNCLSTINHQCSVLTLNSDGSLAYNEHGIPLSQSLTGIQEP